MATEIDEYRNFIDRSSCAGTGKGARMNVFDKSRAESNLFGLCRAKKRCMNEHKIKMLPVFYLL